MALKVDVFYNQDCIGEKGIKILPDNSIDLMITNLLPLFDNKDSLWYNNFIDKGRLLCLKVTDIKT